MSAIVRFTAPLRLTAALFALALLILAPVGVSAQATLDPNTQPKFVNPLPLPGVIAPDEIMYPGYEYYEIGATQQVQELGIIDPVTGTPLPTTVWGYNGTYPGPTIEARSTLPENTANPGKPVKVLFTNDLKDATGTPLPHLLPVDPTLHCGPGTMFPGADHGSGFECWPFNRIVMHLHGGHVEAESDGYPEAWFSPDFAQTGPFWTKPVYEYANDQLATTLWYHDHAMGITRLNVYAGLAAFYILRDDFEDALNLPSGEFEIPMVVQDKMFNADGSLHYPAPALVDPVTGQIVTYTNPDTGEIVPVPSVQPEFFGDHILVNGKTWPFVDVEPRKYRIRFLNGSDSRFYKMWLDNDMPFIQIGSDGGLLPAPVTMQKIVMSPAERFDVILDFTGMEGQTITLRNNARSPYPKGGTVDPKNTGQIMQFRVTKPLSAPDTTVIPATLRPITPLTTTKPERVLDLQEGFDDYGRLQMLLNGSLWDDPVTETVNVGDTEIWTILNDTPDTHPIHIHLVQFQVVSRQKFKPNSYLPAIPGLMPASFEVIGQPSPAEAHEAGWKDTVMVDPGEVVRVIMTFDRPGRYVWHCHILSHEDHEMMRPFDVL